MKRRFFAFYILASLFIVAVLAPWCSAREAHARPLRWQDIVYVAKQMEVPFPVLVLLLHQEDGYVGLASPNTNGTFDYGPFQVNSVHLHSSEFQTAGITAEMLQYDGPTNALAAAWVLKGVMQESDTVYEAIGRYHSSTPRFKKKYQGDFVRRMQSFSGLQAVMERANRGERLLAEKKGVTK